MDSDTRMTKIFDLEMKHESHIHEINLVAKDEESRRHRLRSHAMIDEKDALEDQLSKKDEEMRNLASRCDQLTSSFEESRETILRQATEIKSQQRDIQLLQTELSNVQTTSQDSAKFLAEKLEAARELKLLKPELEHLRSQLAHQQSVIAEKLALERQLNAIEVELEAERRARQKTSAKSEAETKQNATEGEELRTRLSDLESQLALEKKDRQREKKESERALAEAKAECEAFEQRLELMKAKHRETREELKRCQAELSEARENRTSVLADVVPEEVAEKPRKKQVGRKRRAEEITTEITIETPSRDNERAKRPSKKRGLEPTLVGEKSMFSITPFLNKTKMIDETDLTSPTATLSIRREVDQDTSAAQQAPSIAPLVVGNNDMVIFQGVPDAPSTQNPVSRLAKPRGRPRKVLGRVLGETTASKHNGSVSGSAEKTKTLRFDFDPSLAKVVEEPDENTPPPTLALGKKPKTISLKKKASGLQLKTKAKPNDSTASLTSNTSSNQTTSSIPSEPEPKKKKRKLLGGPNKTIFDEEDDAGTAFTADEIPIPEVKTAATTAKRVKVKMGATKPLSKFGKAGGVRMANTMTGMSFSPLKRDRRGVNASFLA